MKLEKKTVFKILIATLVLAKFAYAQEGTSGVEEVNVYDELFGTNSNPSKAEEAATTSSTESSSASATETAATENAEATATTDETAMSKELSNAQEQDDLANLKEDTGEVITEQDEKLKEETPRPVIIATPEKAPEEKREVVNDEKVMAKSQDTEIIQEKDQIFDTGDEEKKLLGLAKFVQGKISAKEWDELYTKGHTDKYEVQKGDWLWKISKKLFGSGFYYAKIWSMNPQITNPHEIEPGTILAFNTGDVDNLPEVKLGEFVDDDSSPIEGLKKGQSYSSSDDENEPSWVKERKKLLEQGVYFQFASDDTFEDLEAAAKVSSNEEYQKYEPPVPDIVIEEPGEEYEGGFDKNSVIKYSYKEGFFLNTFITTNVVQDLGEIKSTDRENVFLNKYDRVFVGFDKNVKVRPGDLFSVYTTGGKINHQVSDRSGRQYSVTAQIKVLRPQDDLWECQIVEISGIVQRRDRITVYTPKINKISRTFSRRNIEAAVIGAYRDSSQISYGDVVYLDRGRADGVELGNVFEVYSFTDRGTEKTISPNPSYKIGELTVITLTDNFATALVSLSTTDMTLGQIAVTKTQEDAVRSQKIKSADKLKDVKKLENHSLDQLDVELNLDDVSQDLLNKADQVKLTDDELQELERQEKEKSVIKDHEKDVKELDRLEGEIIDAEKSLNESKVDEDKLLEQEDLDKSEKKIQDPDSNAFEALDDIEKDVGRKYMDEDLNNKENPYGLTEFDLEEIDELLNTDSKKTK